MGVGMTPEDQREGERRVRALLIDPLLGLGLGAPSTVRGRDAFEAMLGNLASGLAYMTEVELEAMREWVAFNAAGADRDRFPIANTILIEAWARRKPDPGEPPRVVAMFQSVEGRRAIAEDWAPELRRWMRKNVAWCKGAALLAVQSEATEARARVARLEDRRRRGLALSADDVDFLDSRANAARICRELSEGVPQAKESSDVV